MSGVKFEWGQFEWGQFEWGQILRFASMKIDKQKTRPDPLLDLLLSCFYPLFRDFDDALPVPAVRFFRPSLTKQHRDLTSSLFASTLRAH